MSGAWLYSRRRRRGDGNTMLRYQVGDPLGTMVYTGPAGRTYFDVNATKQIAGLNVRRDGHYILGRRKLLLEEAATNRFDRSEPTVVQLGLASTGVTNDATLFTARGFGNGLHIAGGTGIPETAYPNATLVGATAYTLSLFIIMDDAGAPVPSASTLTGDFCIVIDTVVAPTLTVERIGTSSMYRCSGTRTTTAVPATVHGVARFTTQSQRGFTVTGYQIELGNIPTTSIATTGAAATRTAELAYLPYVGIAEEMTIYTRGTHLGTFLTGNIAGLYNISSSAPRLGCYNGSSPAGGPRSLWHNGTTQLVSAVMAVPNPALNAEMETLHQLAASGATRLTESINAGAESAAGTTAANAIGPTFADQRLYLNGDAVFGVGYSAWERIVVARGTYTFDQMRGM